MNGRRLAAAAVGAVLVGAIALAVMPQLPLGGSGFRDWLVEVTDSQDADRGWHLVANWVRDDAYGGDLEAYLADVEAADWSLLHLDTPVDAWADEGFVEVRVNLLSDPATVPRFLLARHIVHGVCNSGGRPLAIGAYENRRPFSGDGFAAGGLTGSQTRCNAAFNSGDGSRARLASVPLRTDVLLRRHGQCGTPSGNDGVGAVGPRPDEQHRITRGDARNLVLDAEEVRVQHRAV